MAKIDLNKISEKKQTSGLTKSADSNFFDFLNKDIKFLGGGLSDKKKERFYSELNILFSAGVDIRSALELIEEEQVKEKDKLIYAKIKEAVTNGSSLSKAIEESKLFSSYEFYSLQIGEESGRLPQVLQELAIFYSKKIQQKRQLTSALSYPAIVFFAAFGAVFFMMKFVVPMFTDVFKRFKGELPYLTRLIIKASDVFSNYSGYMVLIFVALSIFLYTQRNAIWFRSWGAKVVLRTPIMKNLIAKIYLARFCQSMNLLMSAKTPLVTAIDLVKKMVGFYPIESSLDTVQEDILKGESLHKSLSKFKIYNRRMISLIKVAEEVKKLDVIFGKLAKQYSDEAEHETEMMSKIIEPLLLPFL